MAKFDAMMRTPIILAAVLPLFVAPQPGNEVGVIVGIVSWLVFLVDFVVRTRHFVHYTATKLGKFDLAIVILTSPWYLIPGFGGGGFIVILRLARLARVLVVARGARRLYARLGRVVLMALTVLLVACAVAYHAEHGVNPEFGSYWDSLWWGYVTLTTVGYGDVVPVTDMGKWMGVAIMTTGIAVLGVLSGTLASFFRLTPKEVAEDEARANKDQAREGIETADTAAIAPVSEYTDQISAIRQDLVDLRAEIRELTTHVQQLGPPGGGEPPAQRPKP